MDEQNGSGANAPESEAQKRLDIEVKDNGEGWAVVTLKGRVDVFNYLQLGNALSDVAGAREGLTLVLDLSEVGFIASSGWSVLLGVRGRLKRSRSRLALVGMNQHLERIYKAMKLPTLIPSFVDQAAAKAALSAE